MFQLYDFGYGEVPAHPHINGGGMVANTTQIDEMVFVDKNATIWDNAILSGNVKILDSAKVFGNTTISDSVIVSGTSEVSGYAKVSGNTQILDNSKIRGLAELTGGIFTKDTVIFGKSSEN